MFAFACAVAGAMQQETSQIARKKRGQIFATSLKSRKCPHDIDLCQNPPALYCGERLCETDTMHAHIGGMLTSGSPTNLGALDPWK